MPSDHASRQVGAFHRLAALTEHEIAVADDAIAVEDHQPTPAPAVDRPLPPVGRGADVALVDALAGRRTRRATPDEPLGLDGLSWLLEHAARATLDGRRPHPSAGAAYPLRIDLVALRCGGVAPGVHRYDARAHGLRTTVEGDRSAAVRTAFGRDWAGSARVVIVLSADLEDATEQHALRGYRYALLEAGHLAQNLLLLAAAAGHPACPLGGFADTALAELVGASRDEVALYAVAL